MKKGRKERDRERANSVCEPNGVSNDTQTENGECNRRLDHWRHTKKGCEKLDCMMNVGSKKREKQTSRILIEIVDVLFPLFLVGSRRKVVAAQEETDDKQDKEHDAKEDRELESVPKSLFDRGIVVLLRLIV